MDVVVATVTIVTALLLLFIMLYYLNYYFYYGYPDDSKTTNIETKQIETCSVCMVVSFLIIFHDFFRFTFQHLIHFGLPRNDLSWIAGPAIFVGSLVVSIGTCTLYWTSTIARFGVQNCSTYLTL